MSRTIEAIIPNLARSKRATIPTQPKRLTANWQNGLESGGHVQRKLRLDFANAAAQQSANWSEPDWHFGERGSYGGQAYTRTREAAA